MGAKRACMPISYLMAFLVWDKATPSPSTEKFTSYFSLPFRMENGMGRGELIITHPRSSGQRPHCVLTVPVRLLSITSLTLKGVLLLVCMSHYMSL